MQQGKRPKGGKGQAGQRVVAGVGWKFLDEFWGQFVEAAIKIAKGSQREQTRKKLTATCEASFGKGDSLVHKALAGIRPISKKMQNGQKIVQWAILLKGTPQGEIARDAFPATVSRK